MILPTWEFWARQILKQNDLPCDLGGENMILVLAWMRSENTAAQWNPLATTQHYYNSWPYNSAGVQNYLTFADGQTATMATMNNGYYDTVVNSLKQQAKADTTAVLVNQSPWGTFISPSTVTWVRNNYRIIADRAMLSPFPNV